MATTTIADFEGILKRYYLSELEDQLNRDYLVLDLFQKEVVEWNGNMCVLFLRTGRNTGVGVSDDGTLPPASHQDTVKIQVRHKRIYGRIEVDRAAMAAAESKGVGAVISWADLELDGCRNDVLNFTDRMTISGGTCIGYLNQHKLNDNTTDGDSLSDAALDGAASDVVDWEFSGEFTRLQALAAQPTNATGSTWVHVKLIRMDTYEEVTIIGGPTFSNIFISQYDAAASTIGLRLATEAASDNFTTADVAAGYGIAVVLHEVQGHDLAGPTALGQSPAVFDFTGGIATGFFTGTAMPEVTGIFGNLSLPDLGGQTSIPGTGGVARNDAASPTYPVLKSNILTASATGGHGRTALTASRMQEVLSTIRQEVGSRLAPDCLLMNYMQEATYVHLLIGNIAGATPGNFTRKMASGNDVGVDVDTLKYGGIPIKAGQHVPKGMIVFLNLGSWSVLELGPGKWADDDGAVLSRVSGSDVYSAYYAWYMQLICKHPNANGVLCGLSLTV